MEMFGSEDKSMNHAVHRDCKETTQRNAQAGEYGSTAVSMAAKRIIPAEAGEANAKG